MITTVMFDMDGTLIPFQQDDFIKVYFGELCKKLAPLGYEPKHTVDSIWAGTKAMIKAQFRAVLGGIPLHERGTARCQGAV